MKRNLRALDLFCGGGGAAIGLWFAGFHEIVGVDIKKRKNYPFDFIQSDALMPPLDLLDFDFVWASPPCQRYSVASMYHGNNRFRHPDMISAVRELLKQHPLTCIENVPRAPLRTMVRLTGPTVGLSQIERCRHFETSFICPQPELKHVPRSEWKYGNALTITKSMCSSSHFYRRKSQGLKGMPSKKEVKTAMGIPQDYEMTYSELGEAVPPAYSEYIAKQALRQMETK